MSTRYVWEKWNRQSNTVYKDNKTSQPVSVPGVKVYYNYSQGWSVSWGNSYSYSGGRYFISGGSSGNIPVSSSSSADWGSLEISGKYFMLHHSFQEAEYELYEQTGVGEIDIWDNDFAESS